MTKHFYEGADLRNKIKEVVCDYIQTSPDCGKYCVGLRTSEIFRDCGLDWGEYENATSSNQQYWAVALLRELESEGRIKRDAVTKRWKTL